MSGEVVRYLVIGLMSASLHMPAWASDLPQPGSPRAPVIAPAPSFSVTSYIWATAIDGKSATFPPLPAVDINLGLRDVLKELDAVESRLQSISAVEDIDNIGLNGE